MSHAKTIETQTIPKPLPAQKMTYEEFLNWADEDTWAEWVDGEVILLSPAPNWHQDGADFLTALVRFFVETDQLGIVRSAPFQMKIGADVPGREPHLLFIARSNLDRLKERFLDGPADLVVEIITRDSRARDRGAKFYEYEQGGVKEYWLIDPRRRQAEFYSLGGDGIFHLMPVGEEGIFRSVVLPGLWLRVAWLWQEPLPTLRSVLQEWNLV